MNKILIIWLFSMVGCSSVAQSINPIRDTPLPIKERYGIDLISSKELAVKIAELIWKEKYNDDIDSYKPFKVKLVNDGKVWEVIGVNKAKNRSILKRVYHMKINRNTGEILNNWVVK